MSSLSIYMKNERPDPRCVLRKDCVVDTGDIRQFIKNPEISVLRFTIPELDTGHECIFQDTLY